MDSSEKNTFLGWLAAWTVVFVIALLLAGGIHDSGGLQEHEHRGSLPANVSQPLSDTYIVSGAKAMGRNYGGICGPEEAKSGVDRSVPINTAKLPREEDTVLVLCNDGQEWNVDKEKSPNYSQSLEYVLLQPWFSAPLALWLLGILGWMGSIAIPARIQEGKQRKLLKEKQERLALEQAKKERREAELLRQRDEMRANLVKTMQESLTEAWAKPDSMISDQLFEERMSALLRLVEPGAEVSADEFERQMIELRKLSKDQPGPEAASKD